MKNEIKKLENYLVLNKYMYSLFGKTNFQSIRSLLKSQPEGLNEQGRYFFTDALKSNIANDELRNLLDIYDENIQHYMEHINKKRFPRIELKYYQYLAILFTEIYLDRYFNNLDNFFHVNQASILKIFRHLQWSLQEG